MSTFLRFLIGVFVFVYIQVLVFSSVLATTAGARTTTASVLGVTLGGVLLACVPLACGITVSYMTWTDADGRRRVRRLFVILLAVDVLGAALFVFGCIHGGVVVGAWIFDLLVGFALMPLLIAIGRKARARDARRGLVRGDVEGAPVVSAAADSGWVDTTEADVRRGYRNGAIAFVAAVAFMAGVTVLLTATVGSTHLDFHFVASGICIPVLAAGMGLTLSSFRILRGLRLATGPEYSRARRIGRVVLRSKIEALSPDEEISAARYAAISVRWLPYQSVQSVFLCVGFLLTVFPGADSGDATFGTVRIGEAVMFVLILAIEIPLLHARARRVRAYALAHPAS